MKDKLIEKLGNKIDSMNAFISDVRIVDEMGEKTLEVEVDSEDYLDLKTIVKITRVINPIIDELNFIDGAYTLDVYAKEKGDITNE